MSAANDTADPSAERDLTWDEIDALIGDDPMDPPPRDSGTYAATTDAVAPRPRVLLRTEQVTVDRSGGFGALMETIEAPVVELFFEYAGQRLAACDPRDRFFRAVGGGMRVVPRDFATETRARCVLESFGAVDLECLDSHAVPPGSRAHYLLRCDGDVHDYCSFTAWVVPQLRALGWEVELDSGYPYQVVGADEPDWYARVEPDEERPDWFGLELGVELGGRRVNLLPALVDLLDRSHEGTSLARLASRKKHIAVPLPDGRYLTVPPEQVQALLRVISELYEGEDVEPEVLRFTTLQAGALSRLDEIFVDDEAADEGGAIRWEGSSEIREVAEVLTSTPVQKVEAPARLRATLRSYQQTGVEWLQHLRACGVGGILADDMGLGKTLQCIAHLAVEKEAGRLDRPALVVAPTSLCRNWEREIAKFAPFLSTVVLQGSKRHDRYAKIPETDVVITSYPILVRDEERFLEHEWHLLILDEAHTIKNTRSRAHQSAKRLEAVHRLCITGTPIENHLGELWALFDFLNPGLLGDELSFRRWYRMPIEQLGDEERLETLRQQVSPYLMRRLKQQVATELPPKTELVRPVTLGGKQRELYESIRVAAHGEVRKLIAKKGLAASTVPILDALTKLRQVCCDPRLVPMRAARSVQRSAKYELLMELVEGQLGRGHRILIFSQFTRMLALIARGLDERQIGYLSLTGQSKDRQGLVDAYEGGRADVFLISLKAGGVGLTLTSADTVIHYDPWWNPAAQDQATDRAYRIGQTRPVVAYNLFVQGSVEERMLALQQRKRKLAQGILSGAGGKLSLSEDDLEELFAPLG
ncbi:MAG TPA: DEAD/DEAH box helicase [Sandaracinaceae bacterium LLY-WYZ-13_1]|nr:DEAD/DEAH box helicase [Sandaracinaceae bacterium LLY-WYZ-13_1]